MKYMKPFFPPVAYVLVFFSCLFVSCFVFLRRITPFFFFFLLLYYLPSCLTPTFPPPAPFHWLSLPCLSPLPFYYLPSLRHHLPALFHLCVFFPRSLSTLSLCVPCPCNPRPQLLSLCVFVPLSPVLPPMVGCVSCVWMRPRKRSARP